MLVLAIESTCDETGAAIVKGDDKGVEVVSNMVASAAEITNKYGGVVPEVVAREQVRAIIPVIKEAVGGREKEIEAIAVTYGPGLMGSLLIGTETAKVLAWIWKKRLIKVNHLTAHLAANWIRGKSLKVPELPAIGLVVSGGHTDLVLMKGVKNWKWIGGTRDDAAGEGFDKAARILGLSYPGGPAIQTAAEAAEGKFEGKLPRPMINEDNLEMSFSGLKTALVKIVKERKEEKGRLGSNFTNLVAKEFNQAVVEILVKKTIKAVEKFKPRSVLLAGGVAANSWLRKDLGEAVTGLDLGVKFWVPEFKYCTDNAAMVGAAAILRPDYVKPEKLQPEPGLEIE